MKKKLEGLVFRKSDFRVLRNSVTRKNSLLKIHVILTLFGPKFLF